ncbi:ATP synthase F1 subunit gamma [Candidatus Parcubacteria bacterium]|nr:ATP synthase F1 subunit gamma [Candidatus Parcubacteria bacterium]
MASLKAIKGKIRAVDKTRQVTRAMEAVSAVKMRKSQERALRARAYSVSALRILKRLSGTMESREHPLVKKKAQGKFLFIVVTSDRGLAGALNSSLLKAAAAYLAEKGITKEETEIIAIGRKGFEYFERRGYSILEHFDKTGDMPELSVLEEVGRRAIESYLSRGFNRVAVAYTNFRSTFSQEPVVRDLLPLDSLALGTIVEGILPDKGKYSDMFGRIDTAGEEYNFEPSPEKVLAELLPSLIALFLYHALLEARASEFSARMVAMRNAQDKAREVSRALNLHYNQARQSGITREVSEIIGGMETLAA